MKKYIILFILSIFTLISCNNETIKPIDNNAKHLYLAPEFFPTSIGSWWIVHSYLLDEQGKMIGNISEDSIAIVSEKNISGKLALEIITYSKETKLTSDTVYRLIEGDKILEFDEIPFFPFKNWYTLADFSTDEPWITLDTNLVDFDFVQEVPFTGRFTITSQKVDTSNITIKGQEIETIKFKTTYFFSGLFFNVIPMDFNFERTSVFARNIGLVGATDDETKEEVYHMYYKRNIREIKDYMIMK